MATKSKRYEDLLAEVEPREDLGLEDAVQSAVKLATADFDETIELHARLNIDPAQADQQIRGSLVLPAGTGKETRVIVFATGEEAKEAKQAGADEVGGEELIEKIQDGWLEFDQAVATPDMMSDVSVLGQTLGPRGLMPNNKAGTVTFDVGDAIEKLKKGQIELRTDETGIIHAALGTASMGIESIEENVRAVLKFIVDERPLSAAGQGEYIQSLALTPTMGPSVRIDPGVAWEL